MGKQIIDEITRLIDTWSFDIPSKNIAIKSVMLSCNLLLRKSQNFLLVIELDVVQTLFDFKSC